MGSKVRMVMVVMVVPFYEENKGVEGGPMYLIPAAEIEALLVKGTVRVLQSCVVLPYVSKVLQTLGMRTKLQERRSTTDTWTHCWIVRIEETHTCFYRSYSEKEQTLQ